MSALTARLNAVKNTEKMYSVEGANFQEFAINHLDRKGSTAHMMIGALVTAINNDRMTVSEAKQQFFAALEK